MATTYEYFEDPSGQVWRTNIDILGNFVNVAVDGDPGNTTGTTRPSANRDDVIERVHMRTRRVGENVLNMESLLDDCLAEICAENRWPWRRKTVRFTSQADQPTYDLGNSTILAGDVEEIIRVVRVNSSTDRTQLSVIQDPDAMICAIEDEDVTGEPCSYFLEPGTTQTLRLVPTPSGAVAYRVMYWAVPNDSTTIDLLPVTYIRVLIKRMEAEVWALTPGEGVGSPNYAKSIAEYQKGLSQMLAKQNFSTQQSRRFVSPEAIQSR